MKYIEYRDSSITNTREKEHYEQCDTVHQLHSRSCAARLIEKPFRGASSSRSRHGAQRFSHQWILSRGVLLWEKDELTKKTTVNLIVHFQEKKPDTHVREQWSECEHNTK